MKIGDLVNTLVEEEPVVLLKQVAKQVWMVLHNDGRITSEWTLNLVPYELKFA